MPVINITTLQDEAKKRQKDFQYMPWLIIGEVLSSMGINLKNPVKGIDVITELQRKSGIMRPYAVGMTIAEQAEIAKLEERELRLKTAYAAFVDNIKNYTTAPILNNPFDSGAINQSKKDPMEAIILKSIITSFSEDILDALFFGTRNDSGTTPLDAFDGVNTLLDAEITATKISVAKGNQVNTGAIVSPTSPETDFTPLEQIVSFISGANPALRRYPANLYISPATYRIVITALENKLKYKADVNVFALEQYLNDKINSKVKIKTHEIYGKGDRLMLSMPGIIDLGMDNLSDLKFVQVRDVKDDPNLVQYWIQADLGARINSTHKKVLCINDGTATASAAVSGDY